MTAPPRPCHSPTPLPAGSQEEEEVPPRGNRGDSPADAFLDLPVSLPGIALIQGVLQGVCNGNYSWVLTRFFMRMWHCSSAHTVASVSMVGYSAGVSVSMVTSSIGVSVSTVTSFFDVASVFTAVSVSAVTSFSVVITSSNRVLLMSSSSVAISAISSMVLFSSYAVGYIQLQNIKQVCNVKPPVFARNHYYCESSSTGISDPLWDGRGCPAGDDCCSTLGTPWFYRHFTEPEKGAIEVRICCDEAYSNEATLLEQVQLHIQ